MLHTAAQSTKQTILVYVYRLQSERASMCVFESEPEQTELSEQTLIWRKSFN